MMDAGRQAVRRGESKVDLSELRRMADAGCTRTDAVRRFGVTREYVRQLVNQAPDTDAQSARRTPGEAPRNHAAVHVKDCTSGRGRGANWSMRLVRSVRLRRRTAIGGPAVPA